MTLTASAVGPQGYVRRYEVAASAVRQVRRDVDLVLATWHLHALSGVAMQVISELVSNVVDHTASGCRVRSMEVSLTRLDGGVRLAVGDHCPNPPIPREAAPTDEDGRGLLLVSLLAAAWGWEPRKRGKSVWADLLV